MSMENIDKAVEYIKSNKNVRDVVVSGGDPLTLSDEMLETVLSKLRAIPHANRHSCIAGYMLRSLYSGRAGAYRHRAL